MTEVLPTLIELSAQPYVQAVLILIAATAVASLLHRLCGRAVTHFFAGRDSSAGNRIVELLHRPIYITLLLIGGLVAGYSLDIRGTAGDVIVRLINTFLVLMWTVLAYRLVRVMLGTFQGRQRQPGLVQASTRPVISNTAAVAFFIVASYSILLIWDVNITGLIASAGILGLALSFAAQETLSNLFAGISILADRSYEIGDYIVLESGERGEVTHIGLRSTRLLTRDDVGITVPNGVIARAKIINEAAGQRGQYRIRARVGVAYGSSIREVLKLLEDIARGHSEICDLPAPRVRFRSFGDSALELELLCWIRRPADRGRLVHELNCSIYEAFAARDIKIPVPQREITLGEALKVRA